MFVEVSEEIIPLSWLHYLHERESTKVTPDISFDTIIIFRTSSLIN